MKIEIENGRVIDPKNKVDRITNVYIAEGTLCGLHSRPAGFAPDLKINAKNQIVCPGFIELGSDFGDPREDHKGNLENELFAAASGGFTTVCLMPNSDCSLETVEVVERVYRKSKDSIGAKVKCIGALTGSLAGNVLSEMESLKTAGCIGFSNGKKPIVNTCVLRNALAYASTLDLLTILDAQDPWLTESGVMRDGAPSILAGLPGIPDSNELIGVNRHLILVKETGARAHFRSLSVSQAAALVAEENDPKVTSDVNILHLHLCDEDIDPGDPNFNVTPPLPSKKNRDLLRLSLANGKISALSSQHEPVGRDFKETTFESSKPGVSGFDTFLPLMLNLLEDKTFEISNLIASVTSLPSEILRLEEGDLSIGKPANICIFDPNLEWKAEPAKLISWGKNTPFINKRLKGKVTNTIVAGDLVYSSENNRFSTK